MTAMAGVCLYKVNWALLFVWLDYVGGARVRANVVLRATKDLCRQPAANLRPRPYKADLWRRYMMS